MADGITFNFDDLDRLAADLESVPKNIGPFLESAIKFTSVRIKRGAARKVGRRRHFKQAAAAIDFDVKHFKGFGAEVVQSEIGYNKDKVVGEGKWRTPGNLGNIIEFGAPGSTNSLTPGNELVTTLHEEEADFVSGIEKAVDDAHKKAGL
jgi:hypothetical protein